MVWFNRFFMIKDFDVKYICQDIYNENAWIKKYYQKIKNEIYGYTV